MLIVKHLVLKNYLMKLNTFIYYTIWRYHSNTFTAFPVYSNTHTDCNLWRHRTFNHLTTQHEECANGGIEWLCCAFGNAKFRSHPVNQELHSKELECCRCTQQQMHACRSIGDISHDIIENRFGGQHFAEHQTGCVDPSEVDPWRKWSCR